MPDLRIVSWNSTGENLAKAAELDAVRVALTGLNPLYPVYPNVDIYLIQEAQQLPGGAISVALNNFGGYNISHIPEQVGGGGRGYICATRNASVNVLQPLQLWDYNIDPINTLWRQNLPPGFNLADSTGIGVGGQTARTPAYTILQVGGQLVVLVTWHAPIGVSMLPIIMGAMQGGALIDAYLALENSQLVQNPNAVVGVPNVASLVVVAGDLNATAAALGQAYGAFVPLNNFNDGYSNNVDHILAWRNGGGILNVVEGNNTPSTSVHNIISARVQW